MKWWNFSLIFNTSTLKLLQVHLLLLQHSSVLNILNVLKTFSPRWWWWRWGVGERVEAQSKNLLCKFSSLFYFVYWSSVFLYFLEMLNQLENEDEFMLAKKNNTMKLRNCLFQFTFPTSTFGYVFFRENSTIHELFLQDIK